MSLTKAAQEFQDHLDRKAGRVTPNQVHDATWNWTIKALDELKKIAKLAKEAAAAMGPSDVAGAVAMRTIEKRANDGIRAVSKVFGDTKE